VERVSQKRRLFYTDHHELPLPPEHKFPIRKYRMTRELLERDGFYVFEPATLASRESLELVHDPQYVEEFLTGTLAPQAVRKIGFPWSEQLVSRTLASVGGTLSATEDAIAQGFGGTLAGGTHHAFRAEGSGYCVFNDIAIAIQSLRYKLRISRASVIDLDVHQGDGTAKIFEEDRGVLTVSVHAASNFPFRKQRSKVDIELPDGTEDEAYLEAVQTVIPQVFAFRPDIVYFQAGVDPLISDRLGKLSVSHKGLQKRDELVIRACRERKIPLVITLGGGYGEPIEDTARAHANTYRMAAHIFGRIGEL
jgi:acetoin utilization deacetylase AcuC-like enzyme